jgi:hypothetical protein
VRRRSAPAGALPGALDRGSRPSGDEDRSDSITHRLLPPLVHRVAVLHRQACRPLSPRALSLLVRSGRGDGDRLSGCRTTSSTTRWRLSMTSWSRSRCLILVAASLPFATGWRISRVELRCSVASAGRDIWQWAWQAGFVVTGSDASAAMTARAIALAECYGVALTVDRLTWNELADQRWEERFAAAFCVGNSDRPRGRLGGASPRLRNLSRLLRAGRTSAPDVPQLGTRPLDRIAPACRRPACRAGPASRPGHPRLGAPGSLDRTSSAGRRGRSV